jgi:hypothetical protein
MASKHAKQDGTSRVNAVMAVTLAALAFAAIAAFVVVRFGFDATTVARAPAAPAVPQPISQEGRLVAVSPTSVTAESIDGFARTYLIDSQTNAITTAGSLVGGAGSAFAVNDEVAIVGVVRDGTAVATAVAEKQVSNLDGPPMDGF